MNGELLFKLAFVATFVVAVAIAARIARRAAKEHGTEVNQLANEARGLVMIRAMLGVVFYAALFTWLFRRAPVAWMSVSLPPIVRFLATALLIPALAFFWWSFEALGTNYRGGVGLYDNHALITGGPYRHTRHPIYLAFITLMALMLFVSANWVLGASGLALVLSIAAVRTPIEEAQLGDRFGANWSEYARRTPRWLMPAPSGEGETVD